MSGSILEFVDLSRAAVAGADPAIAAVRATDATLLFEAIGFPHWHALTRDVVAAVTVNLGNGGARREPPLWVIEGSSYRLPAGAGYRLGYHAHQPTHVADRLAAAGASRVGVLVSPTLAYPGFAEWAAGYADRVRRIVTGEPVGKSFDYDRWWL